MSVRSVLILEKHGGRWASFLRDYLSDTPAVVSVIEEPAQAPALFDKSSPGVFFAEPCFLSKAFLQKIKVRKSTDPAFRSCLLGEAPAAGKETLFDAVFPVVPSHIDLNKRFVEMLPMPELLRLLVVDDEEEIGTMVRDYFDGRKTPAFVITYAANGKEAFEAIARQCPDVILLDIKMPVMDGREFYAKLKILKLEIPVIVFFDSISGEELFEMRRFGNPAVIEKGCKGSSLSVMMLLVKKLVYFSAK
ncbi:MAG: response regulator [Candidatus Omnitrophota bacterium]|jgi:CheY-like chemotaxis protein